MGFAPTHVFADDTAMVASEVLQNLTDARDWLNGTVLPADVVAADLDESHIQRPEAFGFPTDRLRSTTQDIYHRRIGSEGLVIQRHRRNRVDLFEKGLNLDDITPIEGLMATVFVREACQMNIFVNLRATEYHDAAVGAYPENAGRIVIFVFSRSTGIRAQLVSSTRTLLTGVFSVGGPGGSGQANPVHNSRIYTQASVARAAGLHDVFVAYRRQGAAADTRQVLVGERQMKIEVFYD